MGRIEAEVGAYHAPSQSLPGPPLRGAGLECIQGRRAPVFERGGSDPAASPDGTSTTDHRDHAVYPVPVTPAFSQRRDARGTAPSPRTAAHRHTPPSLTRGA